MSKPKVLELIEVSHALTAAVKAKFDHYALGGTRQRRLPGREWAILPGLALGGLLVVSIDDTILSKLPNLEIVASCSVGTNNVDKALLKSRGVQLTNTGSVHADSAGEFAVGLALSTLRKIVASDRFVRDRKWAAGGSFRLT